MKAVETTIVQMDNGDLVLGHDSGKYIIQCSDCIMTYTTSEMKEVYDISDNDLWMVQEFSNHTREEK